MTSGTIVRVVMAKRFGFIKADGDTKDDIFFHASSIQNYAFNDLEEGMRVEFELVKGSKGPRAEQVSLI